MTTVPAGLTWSTHIPRRGKHPGKPCIRLDKRYARLNAGAVRELLGTRTHAMLHYTQDKKAHYIGFSFGKTGLKISRAKNDRAGSLSLVAFYTHYRIGLEIRTGTYPLTKDSDMPDIYFIRVPKSPPASQS